MGTSLYARGVFLNRCFDELNLTQPGLVADVHRDYVRAGADVIETNTFGANRFKLANFGLAEQVGAINREGAVIARQAARDAAWVAGSIGPLGIRIEPWGKTGVDEAEAAFREQAAALVEGGVDLFVLETFRDLNEVKAAIRAVRSVSALPIVAQMTTEDDGNSLDGTPPETFAPELERAGADVIGVNCSVGPAAMLETIERMAGLTAARLAAQPNAGRPRDVDGRNLYLSSPEYMATYARRFVAAGVRLVGGCCGTTAEHIRQIKAAVRATVPGGPAERKRPRATAGDGQAEAAAPVERREKSGLGRALADGHFAVIVEVAAPRGLDLSPAIEYANRVHGLGAQTIAVTDYPKSGARVSALALTGVLEQRRIETLLHYACRDRQLLGMQSDLLGAHTMGVRNVLLTTGEPPREGSVARSVFDVDAIGLVNMVAQLNRGLDIGGQSIGAPTRFHVGVAVNPFSASQDSEWKRLEYKVEAGAEYLMTPPILDLDLFDRTLDRLRATGLPVIAGVVALDGVRQAEFLANEVPGIQMPERLLARLRSASDEAAEGLAITREIVEGLRARVQGIHVTGLHGSPHAVERWLEHVSTTK
jgi:methionine synthase I (cobalamin-dependent)/5,10-methylenetetrahydrofolate reductase